MNKEKVLNLAQLARVSISGEEAEKLSHEFEAILNYVGEVKHASSQFMLDNKQGNSPIRNIFREDGEGHESGLYTEKLLAEAPAREGNFVKVKKIL